MKKIVLYLLLAIILISFTACGASNVYKSENNGFTMTYPKGWQKLGKEMGTEIMFMVPKQIDNDKFQESISVFAEDNKANLDEYYNLIVDQSKKLVQEYNEVESKKTTVAGTDAYELIYNENLAGVQLQTARYVFKNGDKCYVLTYVADKSQFNTYAKEVGETVNSFKFTIPPVIKQPGKGQPVKFKDVK